jgi:hypothetical protein
MRFGQKQARRPHHNILFSDGPETEGRVSR